MIKILVLISLSLSVAFAAAAANEIFLPPDAESVTIVGDGFRVTVSKLQELKQKWEAIAEEAANIEKPRKKVPETPVVDTNLYEETKDKNGAQSYGPLDDDLFDWIENRATSLTDRVARYQSEASQESLPQGNKIVVEVLNLNTLVSLDNLVKENIKRLKWIKNKLRRSSQNKNIFEDEISQWVNEKIEENLAIERTIKGTNKPTDKWLTNTQAIKRILSEQRYSEKLNKRIVDFLAGTFSLMERSRVFSIYIKDKKLDDGLYYAGSKGHVPANFPFFSQDAIVNGAFV